MKSIKRFEPITNLYGRIVSVSAMSAGFAESKTTEMFQPQSSKGWKMEEKLPICFFHTLAVVGRRRASAKR